MKIAIYGDSFAESTKDYHWANLLKTYFNASISNFGKSGTPLYYSYKKFKQRYKTVDLNIFVVTDPDRYFKEIKDINDNTRFVTSYSHLEYLSTLTDFKDKKRLLFDNKLIQQLEGWYLSSDLEYNIEISSLMVEKILSLDPNTIIIPAFFNSFDKKLFNHLGLEINNNLFDLVGYQMTLLGIKNDLRYRFDYENHRLIDAHLTQEIHEIFYHILLDRIQNKKWNWILPNSVNFQFESMDYYKP